MTTKRKQSLNKSPALICVAAVLSVISLSTLLPASLARGDTQQDRPETTEQSIRTVLENGVRTQKGRGFTEFSCDLPDLSGTPRNFGCSAIDEAGDEYSYLTVPDEEGNIVVDMVTEPVQQVDPDFLAQLDTPCRDFLADYDTQSWEKAWQDFHPGLQDVISVDALGGLLDSMWAELGAFQSITLESFSLRNGGRFELQYSGSTQGGNASFRCGIHLDDDGARLIAFLLTPAANSPLYSKLISEETATALTAELGREVVRVDLPFSGLLKQYEVAEGRGWLDDGLEFAIRVERSGRTDDFARVDFDFQVLDIPLIAAPYLLSQDMEPERFDCPTRVAPDGGTLECVVYLANGDRMALAVARQGGKHRIVRLEQLGQD